MAISRCCSYVQSGFSGDRCTALPSTGRRHGTRWTLCYGIRRCKSVDAQRAKPLGARPRSPSSFPGSLLFGMFWTCRLFRLHSLSGRRASSRPISDVISCAREISDPSLNVRSGGATVRRHRRRGTGPHDQTDQMREDDVASAGRGSPSSRQVTLG